MVPEDEGLALLGPGAERRRRLHRAVVAGQHGGLHRRARTTSCPTNRTARFASALRADDFRKHMHAVRVTPDALRALGPHVVTLAETEGLPAHADSVRRRLDALDDERRTAVSAVPPVRPDLAAGRGLPLAPGARPRCASTRTSRPSRRPTRGARSCWPRSGEVSFHRYPDRPATELRQAVADLHGVTPDEVFCANGSNEVLQSLLLAFGGPGRRALVFEPTYALHSHIARITGTEVVEGARDDDFLIDPGDAHGAARRRERPDVTFLCSPNNPTGRAEPPATVAAVAAAAPGLVVVDEAYGQFSPWSALEPARARPTRGSW